MLHRHLAASLLATAASSAAALATPSTSVSVSGQVGTPGSYDQTALQALPQTTETVTYAAAGSPVTDTFTGPSLWGVLQAAGGITTNPAVKNDILGKYVLATGNDGYEAVLSAGEISPKFGNKPDLVAIADTAGRLPGADGVARVVAAGDQAGGRYVANLASLQVGSGPVEPGTGGGPTTQFVVQGAVGTAMTFNLAALQALTPYTETVTYTAGTARVTDTYTGALLWDVLGRAGITTNPANKNDILRKLVTATGSDGYEVAFSAGELSPTFGDAPILVAYADTNGDLAGGNGFARIVVPGDLAGGRYVSNLASLTVSDPTLVPEPASFALLAAGLLGVAWSRRPSACCIQLRITLMRTVRLASLLAPGVPNLGGKAGLPMRSSAGAPAATPAAAPCLARRPAPVTAQVHPTRRKGAYLVQRFLLSVSVADSCWR